MHARSVEHCRPSRRSLAALYLPLGLSTATQALLQPLLDSGVARMGDQDGLAAFAIATSIVEFPAAPAFLLQHHFLTAVVGIQSHAVFRRFSLSLGILTSVAVLLAAMPGISVLVLDQGLGTPARLEPRVIAGMLLMAPVPGLMALRYYRLGLLLDRGNSKAVPLTSALTVVSGFAFTLVAPLLGGPSEIVGAGGYVSVLAIEAVVSGVLCGRSLKRSPYSDDPPTGSAGTSVRRLARQYWPLAVSQLALGLTRPLANAAILRLDEPTVSVAAFRLATGLSLIAQHALAALRPVVILATRRKHSERAALDVSLLAGVTMAATLGAIGLTPVGLWLFRDVMGTLAGVAQAAQGCILWMTPIPLALGLRQFYSGLLFVNGRMSSIGIAAAIRLAALAIALPLFAVLVSSPGGIVASSALANGYIAEAVYTRWSAKRAFVIKISPNGR